ncbi:MAG: cysteine--tRNA ligase [Spirochaetota bacterium]
MTLRLFNTLGRTLQEFTPIQAGYVGMYACGPTVWNYAHIGNWRTYVFEDLLRRTLEYNGFNVRHIMNITDVGHLTDDADEGEDKIILSAREKGKSVWEIADFFTQAFFTDLKRLNILTPTVSCRATDHIDDMIELIKRIEKNDCAYQAGGNVYFDTSRFPEYGKLALLDRQALKAGARIGVDGNKKNPADFVLWFTKSKFEHQAMLWNSPWGRGYPGWHIECSAMSMKYLGEHFDIHCGGIDHISVHHTNEIAQTEAATGKKWVNYWIHGEYLLIDKAKMAKSAGNFITLDTLQKNGFHPLDYRYFCLGGHYRSQLQFSFESLESAKIARDNLVERMKRLMEKTPPKKLKEISGKARLHLDAFKGHLWEDLNLPRCLAEMWGVLKDPDIEESEKLSLVLDMDRVLGLNLEEIPLNKEQVDEGVLELIRERESARKNRDFKRADEIRNKLKARNILIEDTPEGTRWKIRKKCV